MGQGGTGVFPEFRGKGLGRWLKAAMLGINQALGFRPYLSRCVWQRETDKAEAYLAGSG